MRSSQSPRDPRQRLRLAPRPREAFVRLAELLSTRSLRAAPMRPCVQAEDKRRHRELDCLIPNDPPLPISGGNHTDRIDGRPNWLCLPVAAPGQIHNWATRRSTLGAAVPIAPGDHLNTTRSLTRFQIFLNFCVENAKNCLSPPPKSNSSFC